MFTLPCESILSLLEIPVVRQVRASNSAVSNNFCVGPIQSTNTCNKELLRIVEFNCKDLCNNDRRIDHETGYCSAYLVLAVEVAVFVMILSVNSKIGFPW